MASVPSRRRSSVTAAQWLMPATTGGMAISPGSTPACSASHSGLDGCPVHEHSAKLLTDGAATRIAMASVGAGFV